MKVLKEKDSDTSVMFRLDLIGIAAIFIFAVIITNPAGNFPLNDDWSFGLTVQRLLEKGRYEPYGWAAMPLISNAILGWIFCVPLRFSFDALRISTLTVSLIGLLYLYWLIQNLTNSRWLGICSTLTLAFSPIYFALSHTFMTDVPFTTSLILSTSYLWRYMQRHHNVDLYIGTILSVISALSRQLGLAVPIAFALTVIWVDHRRGRMSKNSIIKACLPAFVSISVLKLFEVWLRANGFMPVLYESKTDELLRNLVNPSQIIKLVVSNGFLLLAYLGCFLLPILAIAGFKLSRLLRIQFSAWIIVGLSIMMALWLYRLKNSFSIVMPFTGNILDLSGIGPLTLHDAFLMGRLNVVELPFGFWLAITLMSILGGGLLLGLVGFRIYSCFRRSSRSQPQALESTTFFWLASFIYIVPLLLANVFDRYFIPVLPLATAAILSQPELTGAFRSVRPLVLSGLAWFLIITFAVFSISSTHDYLAWNRARWRAIDSISNDRQALSRRIDGGFEFNGLYGYDPRYSSTDSRSWWWVKGDDLMISFGPIKGWTVLRSFPYPHLLPSKHGAIYILEKPLTD